MWLSDTDIAAAVEAGQLVIRPWNPQLLQPMSLDVRLGSTFRRWPGRVSLLDPCTPPPMELVESTQPLLVHPGQLVLATTVEEVVIPHNLAAFIEGKSGLGRLGIVIHQTAGVIDPGFSGQLTLEITTAAPTLLYPGMLIAQLLFARVGVVSRPYGSPGLDSHYQGQQGPTNSRYRFVPV